LKKPERIDLTSEELDALLDRVKRALREDDYELIKAMAETIAYLSQLSDEKAASIKRLLRMLFGDKTETAENLTKSGSGRDRPPKSKAESDDRDPPRGHGRNGADDYSGADKVQVPHESLKSGDLCPACRKGKVYVMSCPRAVVRVTGSAPLTATVYVLEKLRCNLCGEIFTAAAPEGMGDRKYDAASGAMIALLKYGSGLPFNRLANLQGALEIPLPASTQWQIVSEEAEILRPVYDELIRQGAQGDILHNDDTVMKILSMANAENSEKESSEKESARTGIFTTGIVSIAEGHRIALFYTGRRHAGENIADLLAKRESNLPRPVQMCDALSRNLPREFKVILTNCLVHGRRNFVDVYSNFPGRCGHVIEQLREVYHNDKIARENGMSPQKRLEYHQAHSGPIMDELHQWLNDQIGGKKVEPNSGLGKAVAYMLNHWDALTGFLRHAGAPLDNNICERALKMTILHRKNALFYKTQRGAWVGDLFMSMIHTCSLCQVNPFKYLKTLLENASELAARPQSLMPWNYTEFSDLK
jgi:transposase